MGMNYKQKAKEYEDQGWIRSFGLKDKEYVDRVNHEKLGYIINCLGDMRLNDFDFEQSANFDKRKKWRHKITLTIK